MKSNTEKLQIYISSILNAKAKFNVEWDCGGDQAILEFFLHGNKLDYDHPFHEALSFHIINKLYLPSVGEISLSGKGEIKQDEEGIFLECESIMHGCYSFEEVDGKFIDEGWVEMNEIDEYYTGKFYLFE